MKDPARCAGRAAAAIGALFLVGSGPALAEGAGAGIIGSPHDFKTNSWNFTGEICRVCHVPHDHGRNTAILAGGLLWNHRLSAAAYTMYDDTWSPTLDNAVDPQPSGLAKLCLGCHDGTVAVDSFDSKAPDPGTGTVFMAEDVNPLFQVPRLANGGSRDLRATHPISIVYDPAADAGLNPKDTAMGFSGAIEDVLEGGTKVQCSTCHDVHDEEAVAGTRLLRVSNTATPSGLCLTCHNKDGAGG